CMGLVRPRYRYPCCTFDVVRSCDFSWFGCSAGNQWY
ncbi:BCCT transporter family protein, partial [Vibrio parahaemolyticus EKP-028]